MGSVLKTEPDREAADAKSFRWDEYVFVWGCWVVMFVTAFWFARTHGNALPYNDEWKYVSVLSGETPLWSAWLLEPHGEHRIPLAKLIWASVIKATNSFKIGAYVNVLALGLLSFMLLWTAHRVTGGLTYTDAIIPLLVLHLGQGYNLQWWWQMNEILPSFVICMILVSILRASPQSSGYTIGPIAVCVMLLPLCGASGMPWALAMSAWLLALGLTVFSNRPRVSKPWGVIAITASLVTLSLIAIYFLVLKKPAHLPGSPGHRATARTALEFLSVTIGSGANHLWFYKGAMVAALLLSALLVLVVAWRLRPGDRVRITGLFMLIVAAIPLAAGLGWARAFGGERAGLAHWYAIFGVPPLCSAYFAWKLYAPGSMGRLVRVCIFASGCMMLALNWNWSRDQFAHHSRHMNACLTDIRDGVILPVIADRHSWFVFTPGAPPIFWAPMVQQLHEAGYPIFRPLNAPEFEEFDLSFKLARTHNATWDGTTAVCGSDDPFLVFALERPQFVYAVQLRFAYQNTPSPVTCQFYWRNSRDQDFGGDGEVVWRQETTSDLLSRTIVINGTMDEFRIDPSDLPSEFLLKRVIFLRQK